MFRLTPPRFWYDQTRPDQRLLASVFSPLAGLWRAATKLRWHLATPYKPSVPVICIGNITGGGTGKTPTAISLVQALQASKLSQRPFFLTRGFGGTLKGPLLVDATRYGFGDVGDEALLLAAFAPTIVAQDRVAGIQYATQHGADCIIVDDGFQNPSFLKTASIIVIDGAVGIGNGRCMPAGPCRETLRDAIARATAILLVGEDKTALRPQLAALPVFAGHFKAAPANDDQNYVAFAGIGRPEKFFQTLRDSGHNLVDTVAFPDHYAYTGSDIQRLQQLAARQHAKLITTQKDHVRLPPNTGVESLPVSLRIDGIPELMTLLRTRLAAA